MRFTNRSNLPPHLYEVLKAAYLNDAYDGPKGEKTLSVTQLIGPPQKLKLERENAEKLELDVLDTVPALLGQALHHILERAGAAAPTHVPERRLATVYDGWIISGKTDLYETAEQEIVDYKNCLPPDTEVLTRYGGFRPITEIIRGEVVLGFEHGTGLKWTQVSDLIEEEAPESLREISVENFSLTATGGHRWPVVSRSRYKGKEYRKPKFKTTDTLRDSDLMVISAKSPMPYNVKDDYAPITGREAALIGLLCTDGWLKWQGNSPNGFLCQKKEPLQTEMRTFFADLISSERTAKNGCVSFRLKAGPLRVILKRAGFHDASDLPTLVTRLRPDCRREMIRVMSLADGSVSGGYDFCNKPGPVLDAFIIMMTMEGKRVGIYDHPSGVKYVRQHETEYLWGGKGRRITKVLNHGYKTVHCLTTGTGTFVIRQGNTVSITGNSSVWTYIFGKVEWEQQLNVYRWISERNGHPVKKLSIGLFCGDWRRGEARRSEDYPARVVSIPVKVWTMDEATAFVDQRLKLHRAAAEGKTPECSPEERWAKPTKYAVMKPGRKTALSVGEMKPEPTPGTYIEIRPGESVRCKDYCSAAPFCSTWANDPTNPQNSVTEEIPV